MKQAKSSFFNLIKFDIVSAVITFNTIIILTIIFCFAVDAHASNQDYNLQIVKEQSFQGRAIVNRD